MFFRCFSSFYLGSFQSLSEFVSKAYGGKFQFKKNVCPKCVFNHSCCDKISHNYLLVDSARNFKNVSPIFNSLFLSPQKATKEEMKNTSKVIAISLNSDESRKKAETLQRQK